MGFFLEQELQKNEHTMKAVTHFYRFIRQLIKRKDNDDMFDNPYLIL